MKKGLAVARFVVGGLLLYAGFSKAVGPAMEFAAAIEMYKLIPAAWAIPLSHVLPYFEMWIGAFLIAGFFPRYAAIAAAALFGVFLLALGSTFVRGIDLGSCGCFGAVKLSPSKTIMVDSVLFLISLAVAYLGSAWTLDEWLTRQEAPARRGKNPQP